MKTTIKSKGADKPLRESPPLEEQLAAAQALAAAMPYNTCKAHEFGRENAVAPPRGASTSSSSPTASTGTLSELNASAKTGALDRARSDASGQAMTTNQGVAIGDNQNWLKAGLRGSTLLEDFILREKITHFDHERIPERIVHARGSAAHGYFGAYQPLTEFTRAAPFKEAGKIMPVFVRFSTVAGERGSTDMARDVRGFAVSFYTDEGNWDLVGNNIPVFVIQDAMKFPDLVHAVNPQVTVCPALSLTALPGNGGVRSRSVAILVANGVHGQLIAAVQAALLAAGATAHLMAPRLGPVKPLDDDAFEATGTLENSPPVLFDGLILPDGAAGVKLLGSGVEVMDFISNQYRHGKTLLALGASKALIERAGAAPTLGNGDADPGILTGDPAKAEQAIRGFITALGKHRHPEREAGAVLQ